MPKPYCKHILVVWLVENAVETAPSPRDDRSTSHESSRQEARLVTRPDPPGWDKWEFKDWPEEWWQRVYGFQIEQQLPVFGRERFDKNHRGSTYTRRWREIRENCLMREVGVHSVMPYEDDENKLWRLLWRAERVQKALNEHPLFNGGLMS